LQSDLAHDNTWVALRENLRKDLALTKEYETFLQQLFHGEGCTLSDVRSVMIHELAEDQLMLLKHFPSSLCRLALLSDYHYAPQVPTVTADVPDSSARTHFAQLSNLRTLLLPNILLASEAVLSELSHTLPHLEELDVSYPSHCNQLEDGDGGAAATVEFQWSVFPHIKKLTLHCCDRSVVQFRFGGCRHLKQLGCRFGPMCHLSQVADLTPLAPQLEVLEVKPCIYFLGHIVDIRIVSSLTSLTELDMEGCHIQIGATYLRGLTKLRKLNVVRNWMSSVSDGWCGGLGSLTQLNLKDNYLRSTAQLSLLTGLTDLNLCVGHSQILSPTPWLRLTRLRRRLTLDWSSDIEFTAEYNLRFLSGFSRLCSVQLRGYVPTTSVEYFDFLPALISVRELSLDVKLCVLGYVAHMTWLESLTLDNLASFTTEYNLHFLRQFSQKS
jgi:Leucine-rich repeat (LRR) protein